MTLCGATAAVHPALAQDATAGLTGVKDNVYGDGLEVTVQTAPIAGGLAAGFSVGKQEDAQYLLGALAWPLGANVTLSGGLGIRSENAGVGLSNASYGSAKLKANNLFVRLDGRFLEGLGLDRAAIAYIHTRVKDTELARNTLSSQTESVIDMGSFTRYLTEYYEQQQITRFEGLSSDKLVGDAIFLLGNAGELTLNLGLLHDSQNGTRGVIGATGKYYGKLA